jgi:RNA polymerase sigma factor (sigma-70 family)
MSSGFETLNLHPQLKRAIDALGFKDMTPIQQKVLKFTLAGHDAIGRAQTGTGKTAAFLVSVINDLLNNPIQEQRYRGEPRALILAPTRELALQIESDAKELTKFSDLHVVTLLGGVDFDKQKAQLDKKPVDIMVATPGRLIDFVEQKEAQSIANDLNVTPEQVLEMEGRLTAYDAAFEAQGDDDDEGSTHVAPALYLEDNRYDPARLAEEEDYEEQSTNALHDAMEQLDYRSRNILQRRWLDDEKSTLHELAAEYNVSAERIRQLEKNAMEKIKVAMSSN